MTMQTQLVRQTPNLEHLNLQYCFRLTDQSVLAMAGNLTSLSTLDLSFCRRLTTVRPLLEYRKLTELRLRSCTGLEWIYDDAERIGEGARQLLNAIPHSLCLLDVRQCPRSEPLVRGLQRLGFTDAAGLFRRPARWEPPPQSS